MKKYLSIIAVLLIIPSITYASWWNPFTWGILSSPQPNQQVQIISTTPPPDQILTDTSTTTATTTISIATTTEVTVATTSTLKINTPVKKVTPPVVVKIQQPTQPKITPIKTPTPPVQVQTSVVSNSSAEGSAVCPDGFTCTQVTPSPATVTCPVGYTCTAGISSGDSAIGCPVGYICTPVTATPTNQQTFTDQLVTATTPCTSAENTKVLDAFLSTHPEYIPANDPGGAKWSMFQSIWSSYKTTNICPQQLVGLLEKTQATYSSSQTTTSIPNTSTTNSTTALPPATSAQIASIMALCTASGTDCNTTLNGYNTNAIFRNNMNVLLQEWQAKQQSAPQQQTSIQGVTSNSTNPLQFLQNMQVAPAMQQGQIQLEQQNKLLQLQQSVEQIKQQQYNDEEKQIQDKLFQQTLQQMRPNCNQVWNPADMPAGGCNR